VKRRKEGNPNKVNGAKKAERIKKIKRKEMKSTNETNKVVSYYFRRQSVADSYYGISAHLCIGMFLLRMM
jgi:hypothetical protein